VVTPAGTTEHPLIRSLLAEGHRFNIFQALSLLERAYPDAPALGGTGPAAREIMRIRPDVSLGFPSGAIAGIDWLETAPADSGFSMTPGLDGRYRVTATFFGLYGADSPLPNHWSEEILYEQSQDTTVRDFLDIFHHRIYSLLFRIWTKYRYPVQYRLAGNDAFSRRFLALIGLGTADWQTAGLPAMRLLRYAGLLVQRPRSGAGLEAFLADWFEGVSRVCQSGSSRAPAAGSTWATATSAGWAGPTRFWARMRSLAGECSTFPGSSGCRSARPTIRRTGVFSRTEAIMVLSGRSSIFSSPTASKPSSSCGSRAAKCRLSGSTRAIRPGWAGRRGSRPGNRPTCPPCSFYSRHLLEPPERPWPRVT
jgi:hypothetical protein